MNSTLENAVNAIEEWCDGDDNLNVAITRNEQHGWIVALTYATDDAPPLCVSHGTGDELQVAINDALRDFGVELAKAVTANA